MSKETIRRAKHGKETPYFSMSRATAQDKSLSYEARGMLCYLLSKPDDWEVHIHDLILKDANGDTKTGKSKLYNILSELADAGYIVKPKRYTDDKGRIQWTAYEVYEQPVDSSKSPHSDLPDMVSPDMAEPYTEKPDNKIIEITERYAKEENRKEKQNPTMQEADAAIFTAAAAPDGLPKVVLAYEQNIGVVTPMIRDKLIAAIDDYTEQWIIDAIDEAVSNNVRKWNYCNSILERWHNEGRKPKNTNGNTPTKTTGVDFSAKLAEMGITPDSPEYTETINCLMAEHYAERERRAQAIHAKQFEKVAS